VERERGVVVVAKISQSPTTVSHNQDKRSTYLLLAALTRVTGLGRTLTLIVWDLGARHGEARVRRIKALRSHPPWDKRIRGAGGPYRSAGSSVSLMECRDVRKGVASLFSEPASSSKAGRVRP